MKVLLLAIAMLLPMTEAHVGHLEEPEVNGQDTATPAPATNTTCKDPMFECPPPMDGVKVAFYSLWTVWQFALAGYWAWTIKAKLSKTNTYLGPAFCVMQLAFVEGIFFLLRTTFAIASGHPFLFIWGMALQICGAVGLWMLAFFFSRIGFQWTTKGCIWRVCILLALALILATTFLVNMYQRPSIATMKQVEPIFLLAFEPPQVLILLFAVGHVHVSCGFKALTGGLFLLWASHVGNMLFRASYPVWIYIPLQMLGSALGQFYGMTKLCTEGEFEKKDCTEMAAAAGINLDECKKERAERETRKHKTHVCSPEGLINVSAIFVVAGYLGSAMCLLLVNKYGPENFYNDPIYRIYQTFHPCILLDYLPGTLIAQPLYGASLIAVQFALLMALFRATAYGDGISTMLQAMLYGWYWLLSCFFILVFTFNPASTSVLMHSLPYMAINQGNAFMMITFMITMYRWKGLRGTCVATGLAAYYSLGVVYNVVFMSSRLMSDAGLNLLDKSATDPKALEAVKDVAPVFNPLPMFLTFTAQFVLFGYGIISPLKHRPVAFEVFSHERNVAAKYSGDPNAETDGKPQAAAHPSFSADSGARNFRVQLKPRIPLLVAVCLIAGLLVGAWEFDRRIHPEYSEGDYREIFRRQPGSAIVAAGWIAMENFLIVHVALTIMHEWYTNDSAFLKHWVALSGIVLLVVSLVAIAGTIPDMDPNAPTYVPDTWYFTTEWFKGLEAFMITLGLWVFTDAALCTQTLMRILKAGDAEDLADEEEEEEDPTFCQRFLKPLLAVQIILGLACGVCLLLIGFHVPSWGVDVAMFFLLIVYAIFDARGVDVILANMRVATPTDLLIEDVDGDLVLPVPVIKSMDCGEDEYEYEYCDEGEVLGKSDEYES